MEKSYLNFKNDKELFDFIRSMDVSETPELSDVFFPYNFEHQDIENVLKNSPENNSILIDARSETEFESSHLPGAINFPVLNNSERHFVGNLYKNYSKKSAIWLAIQYATQKIYKLENFLNTIPEIENKNLVIYCWRGGGRSKYLSKMIFDSNSKLKIKTLKGGFKSYRQYVIDFFNNSIKNYNFIELTGLTGCNKSKIIELSSSKIKAINLEFAARHQSSLFGNIPYKIRGFKQVKDQSSFENNLFSEFYKFELFQSKNSPYLIESESRKIGNFIIPEILQKKIIEAKSVLVEASLESRISTIRNDYFMDDLRGLNEILKIFTEKAHFFKQKLSNKIYSEMLDFLNEGKVDNFIEYMLVKYYDLRYKDKGKKPLLILKNVNLNENVDELIEFVRKYTMQNNSA